MPSILFVDDESSLLELGKIYLEKKVDFQVDTVLSGAEAIDILNKKSYDVIVSDYEMSGMNGIELLKQIRSQGDETPFIIFTGRSREEVVIEALNAGATYYLQKGGQSKSQFSELIGKINAAADASWNKKELKKTNRFLADVYSAVKDGISLLDTDFNIQYINPTMEEWYGPKEEAIGKKCYEFYHGKDEICDFCPSVEAIRTNCQNSNVIPGGKGRNIEKLELFANPVHDDDGNLIGVLEFVRDINPRLKMEQALRNSEDIYKIYLDYADDIVYTTDSNLLLDSLSPSVERVLGFKQSDLIGKPFLIPVHPDDRLAVEMNIERVIMTGEFEYLDVRLSTSAGYKWFNTMFKPILNDTGVFTGLVGSSKYIHDRKMMEQELRNREEMYRLMIENSLDVIWMMDLNGEFTYLSPSLKNITGHEVLDFMKSGAFSYLHPDEHDMFHKEISRIIDSDGYNATIVARIRHADDNYYWYQAIVSTLKDEMGEVIGLMGISRNINHQRAAEDRYQTLFASMTDACALHEVILDDDGIPTDYRFLDSNPAFSMMTGLDKEDIIGRSVKDVLPNTENHWIDMYGEVALTQVPIFFSSYSQELESFFQVYAFSPQRLKFITIFDDVTPMVESQRRLLESERRFDLAMEGTGAGLWDWDIRRGIVKQSARSMEMIGLEAEEKDVSLEEWAQLYHPDDIAIIDTAVNNHLQNGKDRFSVNYRIRHSEGRWVWIKARGKLIRDINGQPSRFVGTNMDITDEMEMRDSLLESNKKLQTLASITRHDILNNLLVVQGYLELLESDELKDRSSVFKNINHAAKMIESNIRFSRDYQNIGREKSTWMPLHTMICEISDDRLVGCEDFCQYEIFADPMLYKVFNNLYDNTRRHAPQATRISLDCEVRGDSLVINYEDDGPGVPQDEKEKIFERGYGKHTGHGLYLAKEILSFTGISIFENGVPGQGARFEIVIPKGGWHLLNNPLKNNP